MATGGRLVLGAVFVVAGALKVPDPAAAVRAVRAYQLLPEPLVAPVAFGLPVVEIAVGLALLLGVFVRTAAIAVGRAAGRVHRRRRIGVGPRAADRLRLLRQRRPGRRRGDVLPARGLRDVALLLVALVLARWPASRLALGGRLDAVARGGVPCPLRHPRGATASGSPPGAPPRPPPGRGPSGAGGP